METRKKLDKIVTIHKIKNLLLGVVALAFLVVSSLTGGVVPALAGEEIPILGIIPITGPYADSGMTMDRGMKLAIEHMGGKVLGKPIKYVKRDSETKGGAAVRRVEEAISEEKVKAIIGPWSSGVALAVSDVAKNRKIPHLFSGGTSDLTGKRCHKYSFMWAASPYTAANIVVEKFLEENPNAKRWYTFTVDYAFGYGVLEFIKKAGEARGVTFIGNDYLPLGEREYGQFITKVMAKKPDVLCMINFGLDAISAVRQSYNYGLMKKTKVIMTWSSGVEELRQLTPKIREGLYVGSNFYYTVDNPIAKKFYQDYHKKYNEAPGYAPAAAYSMTRVMLKAMGRAKSTNSEAIV
nr:ABC transporter substrate-binding protein [Deltaproteobacteria bacterium]